jgi:hypothetical protein
MGIVLRQGQRTRNNFCAICRDISKEIEDVVSICPPSHNDQSSEPDGDEPENHPTVESICEPLLNMEDARMGVLLQHLDHEVHKVTASGSVRQCVNRSR